MGPGRNGGIDSDETSGQSITHYKRDALTPANHRQFRRQARAYDPALELSFDNILKHGTVQGEIGNDLF